MTKGKPQTTKNNTAQENLTERLERKETVRGTALTITGGFAGVFGKYTFEYKGVTATWIVNVRLIIAGIILLTRAYMVQKDGIFRIWKNKRHVLRMLVYGVIGIAGCQMTYYLAVEDSNAGIATVLQYTAPVMIMVLLALKNWKLPGKNEILALILAFGGTVLLATHGNLTQLSVSKTTLIFGLSSAVQGKSARIGRAVNSDSNVRDFYACGIFRNGSGRICRNHCRCDHIVTSKEEIRERLFNAVLG